MRSSMRRCTAPGRSGTKIALCDVSAAAIVSALAIKTEAPTSSDQIGRASYGVWFGSAKGAKRPGSRLDLRAQKMRNEQSSPGVRSTRRVLQGFFRLGAIVAVAAKEFPGPGGLMQTSKVVIAVKRWRPILNKHAGCQSLSCANAGKKAVAEALDGNKLSAKIKSVQRFFFKEIYRLLRILIMEIFPVVVEVV